MSLINRNHTGIAVLVLAIIVVIAGCGGGGSRDDGLNPDQARARTLSGTVMSDSFAASVRDDLRFASGMTPVAGAKVWLETSPDTAPVFTDASGTYVFKGISAAEHFIVASYNQNNKVYKQRVRALVQAIDAEVTAPQIGLAEAVSILTGILRDAAGEYIPAGTEAKLWGETFTIGSNGRFQTPPLPASVSQAPVFVKVPGSTNFSSFSGSFVAGNTPAFVEQTIMSAQSENQAPSGSLVAKNSIGVSSVKCVTNEQMRLELSVFDPDPTHADRLTLSWNASRGSLQVAGDRKSATWTAMETHGVATISVKITDPEQASSKVSLRMLVGVNSMEETDTTPPAVAAQVPAAGATAVDPGTSVSVEFSKTLLASSVTSGAITVSHQGTPLSGTSTLQADGKTISWTPSSALSGNQTYSVGLLSTISDLYGNQLGSVNTWTFTTTITPVVTVNTLHTNDSTPILNGTIDDPEAAVAVTVGGNTYNATVSGNDWSAAITQTLADGVYNVSAKATNSAGVSGYDKTTNELHIDTAPKTAVLTNAPASLTGRAQIEITVGGTGVTRYRYKLNDEAWSNVLEVAEPISHTLAEGEHVIRVVAGDAAGNWQAEASATTHSWTLDTSIKVAELENPPPALTNQTLFVFTVGGEGVTKYKYRLNDYSWSGEISVAIDINFGSLDSGSHVLRLIGGDDAGNWQSEDEPTIVEWVIDATAKTAVLSGLPNSPTNQTSASITVDGTGVTKYKYYFNNNTTLAVWSPEYEIDVPIVLEDLVDGTQTLKVIAGDELDNWQTEANATVKTWVVDTADVTVAITRKSDQPELSNAPTVYFVAQFNKPVAGFDESDVVISGDALADTVAVATATAPADGSKYEIAVSGMTSDGIVEISIPENSAQDAAGNYNLASDNSEDTNNRVTIDNSPATVVRVTSAKDDGHYAEGETIVINVEFNKEVSVAGQPLLVLDVREGGANAAYTGREDMVLSFSYIVAAGDNSENLDYVDTESLKLNNSTIKDMAGNDAELVLPAPGHADSISGHKSIVIDTTAPAILRVEGVTDAYKVDDDVDISVVFDEPVKVDGVPYITLALENGHRHADYVSGSETDTLVFRYVVQDGDHSMDLDYVGSQALVLYSGSTIKDLAGNAASILLAEPGAEGSLGHSSNIEIRGVRPKIIGITSTKPNGAYGVGAEIDIVIQFDANVSVSYGVPSLFLNTDPEREVNLTDGNGTASLTFVYTVQENDKTTGFLDYRATDPLALNGATVYDLAENEADLTFPAAGFTGSLASNKAITIDTTAPVVQNVSAEQNNGNFKAGDVIDITVEFDKIVQVDGVPHILIAFDGGDYAVNYHSGNYTNKLYFRYTVQNGHVSAHLDYPYAGALELNAGSIKDIAGNDAVLTLAAPGESGSLAANKTLVIDALAPAVLGVSSTIVDGTYPAGEVIPISIQFSEVVRVSGTPQLTLATTPERYAAYVSGHNSDTLIFNYTVQAGDTTETADLDYSGTDALTLSGGTIRDAVGNNAVLTLAAPGAAGSLSANNSIVIDGVLPEVVSVSSDEVDGTYILGDSLEIKVIFDKEVTVTDSPILTLNTNNSPNSVATYTSGSGATELIFTYTVQPGDYSTDLDYAGTTALSLNGGTIKNAVGNSADLALIAPGSEGSLSFGKALVINGIQPKITNVTSDKDDGTYMAGESINIMVHFDKTVNVIGTPVLELNSGVGMVAVYNSGTTSDVLTFIYHVGADENSADLDYFASSSLKLEGGSIVGNDPSNAAYLILPAPGAAGSLAANKNIVIDTKAPRVINVTSNLANGTYYFGKVIDLTVTFDEVVVVDTTGGTPTLKLSTGSIDRNATYQSGSDTDSLVFRYTVQTDDVATPLEYVEDTNALALNLATIKDAVGNDAVLTLPAPGSDGSLSKNKTINVNGVRPRVVNVTSSDEDDTYTSGNISIQIQFSEVVTVTGTPQLELNTTPSRFANYSSGNNGDTLTFTYSIEPGDSTDSHPLDYASTGALTLNGGTIENGNGVEAILLLSPPGDAGSLVGNSKVIIIDAPAP